MSDQSKTETGVRGRDGRSRVKVYVAGPLSGAAEVDNLRAAILTADVLMDLEFAVYVPHLATFHHLIKPRSYSAWITHDLEWLSVCDAVLRLPGRSPGADVEVREAERLGIPLFTNVQALHEHFAGPG